MVGAFDDPFERNLGATSRLFDYCGRTLEQTQHELVGTHQDRAQVADTLALARQRRDRNCDSLIESAQVVVGNACPEAFGHHACVRGVGHVITVVCPSDCAAAGDC